MYKELLKMINKKYEVRSIDNSETWPFLLKKHYLKRIPSITYSFGLINLESKFLEGVVTYGVPVSPELRQHIVGSKFEEK